MLCVAAVNADVVHAAVRVFPAPLSATAPQVVMVVPPSVKLTVPVGAAPVTDAVNVTLCPTVDGLSELITLVVIGGFELTTCDSGELLDTALEASPPYAATMLCVPAVSAAVLQTAVRVFPAPVSATAPQPLMVVPPSVKLIVPVGAEPVTEAVKATLAPTVEGLRELTS